MNNLDKCLDLLQKIENRSYRGKERVVVTLEDVAAMLDLFVLLDEEEQNLVKDCVSEKAGRIMITFTGAMGRKAIETKDSNWLRKALLLHVLENVQFDDRENLRELFLLDQGFNELGLDKRQMWSALDKLSTERVKKYLIGRH